MERSSYSNRWMNTSAAAAAAPVAYASSWRKYDNNGDNKNYIEER